MGDAVDPRHEFIQDNALAGLKESRPRYRRWTRNKEKRAQINEKFPRPTGAAAPVGVPVTNGPLKQAIELDLRFKRAGKVTAQVRLRFFPQTTVQNFLDKGI